MVMTDPTRRPARAAGAPPEPDLPGALAIGLDVGGSKIAACVFDIGTRRTLRASRTATRSDRGGGAVLDDCVAAVESLAADAGIDAARTPLGLGVCELVAPAGCITSAANFDWRGVDLAARFRSPLLVVEADVRSAAYAEAWIGAGAGCSSFVYLTVGTGIAFTLVIDGRPHAGAHGNALILGVPPVESTSSGAALAAAAGVPTAQDVFARVELRGLIDEAAAALGRAMAWLVNALDPELIVIGGGLGMRREYREAATDAMRPHIEARPSGEIPVVPAALGAESGAIGAAAMAARAAGIRNQKGGPR
jgi:glucokinase